MKIHFNPEIIREKKDVLIYIVVVIFSLFFAKQIWKHHLQEVAGVKKQIDNADLMVDLAGQIKSASKEAETFKVMSWPTNESVEIMGQVNKVAARHGVDIITIDPGSAQTTAYFTVFSINLNVHAGYFDLFRFISSLERLKHLSKVENVQIVPLSGSGDVQSGPRVRSTFTVKAYSIHD